MANARQRIVLGASVTLVGALMFLVASGYVIDHGLGKWLGLAVGLIAFPIAPGAWHFIGERKRAKKLAAAKKPPSQSLTGGDRLWMRLLAVAIVVIGPMIAISRAGVVKSAWHQKGWWWPASHARTSAGEKDLLSRVPASSELVAVVRIPEDKQLKRPAGTAVAAWSDRQGMLAADAAVTDGSVDDALKRLEADRDKVPWLPLYKLVAVETTGPTRVIATEDWKDKVRRGGPGPRAEIAAELARAPSSAQLAVGYVPASVGASGITRAAMWLTASSRFVAEARIETRDEASAEALVTRMNADPTQELGFLPESCREPVKKLADATKTSREGVVVTSRLDVPVEQVGALLLCGLSFGR